MAAQALELRLAGSTVTNEHDHATSASKAAGAPAAAAPVPGAGVAEALRQIRARIHHLDGDREPGPDLAAAFSIVHDGLLADLAGPAA